MMHENPTATRKFDVDTGLRVFTMDGDADPLAFYDPTSTAAWISINEPVDAREWR